jgi:hypothetical protein
MRSAESIVTCLNLCHSISRNGLLKNPAVGADAVNKAQILISDN